MKRMITAIMLALTVGQLGAAEIVMRQPTRTQTTIHRPPPIHLPPPVRHYLRPPPQPPRDLLFNNGVQNSMPLLHMRTVPVVINVNGTNKVIGYDHRLLAP